MERSLLNGDSVCRHMSFKDKFIEFNFSSAHNKKIFLFRALFTFTLAMLAIINSYTAAILPDKKTDCIYDALHNSASSINSYFQTHVHDRDVLLICSSILIDMLLLSFAFRFSIFGTTWRPLIWLIIFYMSRCVVQVITI